jgi:hypothetical protein
MDQLIRVLGNKCEKRGGESEVEGNWSRGSVGIPVDPRDRHVDSDACDLPIVNM